YELQVCILEALCRMTPAKDRGQRTGSTTRIPSTPSAGSDTDFEVTRRGPVTRSQGETAGELADSTSQRPPPQTRTGTGTAERLNEVAEQNTMMMGQSKGRCPKK
ncbi:unnamed protein product, partial [Gadus morhua 'NCC']